MVVVRRPGPPDGVLQGTVVDRERVPLSGAIVSALPGDGRKPAPAVATSEEGRFTLPLGVGFYTVHIAKEGFEDIWQTVVFRESGAELAREFLLEPAATELRHRP